MPDLVSTMVVLYIIGYDICSTLLKFNNVLQISYHNMICFKWYLILPSHQPYHLFTIYSILSIFIMISFTFIHQTWWFCRCFPEPDPVSPLFRAVGLQYKPSMAVPLSVEVDSYSLYYQIVVEVCMIYSYITMSYIVILL